MARRQSQEGTGGTIRFPMALFPIAQGPRVDAKGCCELRLAHAHHAAEGGYT